MAKKITFKLSQLLIIAVIASIVISLEKPVFVVFALSILLIYQDEQFDDYCWLWLGFAIFLLSVCYSPPYVTTPGLNSDKIIWSALCLSVSIQLLIKLREKSDFGLKFVVYLFLGIWHASLFIGFLGLASAIETVYSVKSAQESSLKEKDNAEVSEGEKFEYPTYNDWFLLLTLIIMNYLWFYFSPTIFKKIDEEQK